MRAGRRAACLGLLAATLLVACDALPAPTPSGCPTAAPTAGEATEILDGVTTAVVETSLGTFTLTLNPGAAPIASANFVALAECGFYNGLTFHRVLSGFVIQAGDPNTRQSQDDFEGLGSSGPGYGFAIELPPDGLNYDPYTVAMANTGEPDSNGSQFFIALSDLNARLDRTYTIFGLVTEGREVVDAIGQVEVTGVTGVPVDPVVIRSIEIPIAESTPS
ncbi:MAG TPA: peptidylprolyl isomerase [Candidatus Limnocylindria bacterium]|jgi:cyclophilin family peptidyl-prolyl cis-trans isomerase